MEKKFGKELILLRVHAGKVKNAQEAHESIRPTHLATEHVGNTPEQKKLYELIWQRTVASQMPDAEMLRTKITANISPTRLNLNHFLVEVEPRQAGGLHNEIPDFVANGIRLLSPGRS